MDFLSKDVTNYKSKIVLGSKVRDTITGFEGVAIGVTFWLTGCARLGVKPVGLHEGKTIEAEWFDEDRLEVMTASQLPYGQPNTGGPQEAPKKPTPG